MKLGRGAGVEAGALSPTRTRRAPDAGSVSARLPAPLRWFWRAAGDVARGAADAEGERRTWWMLRALYGFAAAATLFDLDLHHLPVDRPRHLIWPVLWLALLPWPPLRAILRLTWLVHAVTALRPRSAALRWSSLIVETIYIATSLSQRGLAHRYHLLLVTLAFAALLPSPRRGETPDQEAARRVVSAELLWSALAFGLLFYSMSGTTKLIGIAETLHHGDGFFFDFSLPPKQLWQKAYSFQPPPLLSAWVLEHPASAKLGYFAVLAVELASFPAAFSRRLVRPWIVLLASFHVATYLSMKIFFLHSFVVLMIWLLLGPLPRPLHWPRPWRRAPRSP